MRPESWDHFFCNGHITTGTSQINLQFYKETKEKSVETLRFNALWCVGWPVLLAVYSFSFSASCPAATSRSKSLWYRRSCKMRYCSNSLSAKALAMAAVTLPLSCSTSASLNCKKASSLAAQSAIVIGGHRHWDVPPRLARSIVQVHRDDLVTPPGQGL